MKKFDPTKPVQTKRGLKVRIMRTDIDNENYPISALLLLECGDTEIFTFTKDGKFRVGSESSFDLVNIPEEVPEKVACVKEMKEFDPTKPVQTRGGRKARIVAADVKGTYPIAAMIYFESDDSEIAAQYTKEGRWFSESKSYPLGCSLDLVNIEEKKFVYVNLYRYVNLDDIVLVFPTKEEADRDVSNRISCIKVECKEGQFDE